MISLEEYTKYYKENNRFYCGSYINQNKEYNEKQIKTKYEKYVQKIQNFHNKQEQKVIEKRKQYEIEKEIYIQKAINNELEFPVDEKWEYISGLIKRRDNNQCRLEKIISKEEKIILYKNTSKFFLERLEVAHCIARSHSKKLYYNLNNLYLLNCFSHKNLDEFKCPLSGKWIGKEQVQIWWKRIINNDRIYNWLKVNK